MGKAVAYRVLTGLLAGWLTLGGVVDTARAGPARAIITSLGYPDYLLLILGPAKLLAVLALLYPKTRFLREWAYAGIAVDGLGAFVSHCAIHDTPANIAAPLVFLALAAGSYALRPDALRLTPRSASG
ncbi:MAG TPA: DoxX family protein [Bryobacteraceae bacterium]|nr:DoxX family protein [Bryobacteraceae bacterium]